MFLIFCHFEKHLCYFYSTYATISVGLVLRHQTQNHLHKKIILIFTTIISLTALCIIIIFKFCLFKIAFINSAAMNIIARTWKQPRCPSADEWIRKLWYIYTMEYYSAIKNNTFLTQFQWGGWNWSLLYRVK